MPAGSALRPLSCPSNLRPVHEPDGDRRRIDGICAGCKVSSCRAAAGTTGSARNARTRRGVGPGDPCWRRLPARHADPDPRRGHQGRSPCAWRRIWRGTGGSAVPALRFRAPDADPRRARTPRRAPTQTDAPPRRAPTQTDAPRALVAARATCGRRQVPRNSATDSARRSSEATVIGSSQTIRCAYPASANALNPAAICWVVPARFFAGSGLGPASTASG